MLDVGHDSWRASVTLPVEWEVRLHGNVFGASPDDVPDLYGAPGGRRFVIVDDGVWHHKKDAIRGSLARYGVDHGRIYTLPGGEATKSPEALDDLITAMDAFGLQRLADQVVIIGGGVVHDLGMLAASEYRRGVPAVYIASTLVGAIDAGLALKCGIDHRTPNGRFLKNRRGLYAPARLAWVDPTLLSTLPDEQILEGVPEILKWAIAADVELFKLLETHGPTAIRHQFADGLPETRAILTRTIRGMMGELEGNPLELNPQRRSYFGHNFSFGIEPDLSHGPAVGIDCAVSSVISHARGYITAEALERIIKAMQRLGLPLWHPALEDEERMAFALDDVTRHRGGQQLVTLPHYGIGTVRYVNDITPQEVKAAAALLR